MSIKVTNSARNGVAGSFAGTSQTTNGLGGFPLDFTTPPVDGDVPVYDSGSGTFIPGSSTSGMVPYYIAPTETFTVPLYKQALYQMTIDNEGTLNVLGFLIEVD